MVAPHLDLDKWTASQPISAWNPQQNGKVKKNRDRNEWQQPWEWCPRIRWTNDGHVGPNSFRSYWASRHPPKSAPWEKDGKPGKSRDENSVPGMNKSLANHSCEAATEFLFASERLNSMSSQPGWDSSMGTRSWLAFQPSKWSSIRSKMEDTLITMGVAPKNGNP